MFVPVGQMYRQSAGIDFMYDNVRLIRSTSSFGQFKLVFGSVITKGLYAPGVPVRSPAPAWHGRTYSKDISKRSDVLRITCTP